MRVPKLGEARLRIVRGRPPRGWSRAASGPTAVLRTHLLRPRLPVDAVPRERLLATLASGLSRPLILLSAPAGAGKTTLLGQWLADPATPPAAWLSLGQPTSRLPAFVAHVVAGLQTVAPTLGQETLALLALPRLAPASVLGDTLAEELLAHTEDLLLVLDDYHTVSDSRIHALVGALLEHPPPRLHLALASRYEPPLPLVRLRAQGKVLEIGGADLRFTLEETTAFLQTTGSSGHLSTAIARPVQARSEGWAAGVRLAALAAGGRLPPGTAAPAAPPGTADLLSGPALDFLAQEALAQQPPLLQAFLIRAAVLDHLCAPLCDALLAVPLAAGDPRHGPSRASPGASVAPAWGPGRPPRGGQALLAEALRRNLFLVPLEAPETPVVAVGDGGGPGGEGLGNRAESPYVDGPRWYRYHQLFRAALRRQLRRLEGAAAVQALHAAAGRWLAAQGLVDEAVRHTLAAGDAAGAAAIVEEYAPAAFARWHWQAVERWLALLPPIVVETRPALLLAGAGVMLFHSQFTALRRLLDKAVALLDSADRDTALDAAAATRASPEGSEADAATTTEHARATDAAARRTALRGEIDALTCIMAEDGPAGALAAGYRALERLPVEQSMFGLAFLSDFGAAALLAEGLPAARQRLTAVAAAPGGAGELRRLRALVALSGTCFTAGALREAYHTAARVLRLAPAGGTGAADLVKLILGLIAYEWNDLDAAAAWFDTVAHHTPHLSFMSRSNAVLGQALVDVARGCADVAWSAVSRLVDLIVRTGNDEYLPPVRAFQSLLLVRRGDATQAGTYLGTVPRPNGINLRDLVSDTALIHAKVWLASADATPAALQQSQAYLAVLHTSAVAQHLTRREIEILALQALVVAAQGDTASAMATLERALTLAAPEGFVRTFADLGAPLVPLLQEIARRHPDDAYPRRLLAALVRTPAAPSGRPREEALLSPLPRTASPEKSGPLTGLQATWETAPLSAAGHEALIEHLTYREQEVLAALLRRLSNKEIAHELGIALSTVKRHVANVYGKLGVGSRREAERLAKSRGWVPFPARDSAADGRPRAEVATSVT